jgi:hypothetical protein
MNKKEKPTIVTFRAFDLEDGTTIVEIPKDRFYFLAETNSTILLRSVENIGVKSAK